MHRLSNLILGLFLLPILIVPIFFISLVILAKNGKPILYWSERVGKDSVLFSMPKFRTMYRDTPEVATHLLNNADSYLTSFGKFLRKTSLDELPQIYSVIKGNMNFVGPRPALYNQDDLMSLRIKSGVDKLVPGITGWAQINGRDDLLIPDKVKLELEYLNRRSIFFDIKILYLTVIKVLSQDSVRH
jgi:O-antigen biosynthesis protein WbqP